MPLITVKSSIKSSVSLESLQRALSTEISSLTSKPEKYVMTIIQTGLQMSFGGTSEPCCFVEVKSIGSLLPKEISKVICKTLESHLDVPSERIYIEFVDVNPENWGFNKTTFG